MSISKAIRRSLRRSISSSSGDGGAPAASTKLDISYRNYMQSFGDSITAGIYVAEAERYVNLIAADYRWTLTNNGVSARGVLNQAAAAQNLTLTTTKSDNVFSWMAGFNDVRRATDHALTRKKIEACTMSFLLACFGDEYDDSFGSNVTRTGSFSPYVATAQGGKFATTASYTNTNGNTWEWDFTGTEFGLQFIAGGATSTYGVAKIYVDDVLIDTVTTDEWFDEISDGANANTHGPLGRMYHGYSDAAHTVKVECFGSDYVVLDYFCTLKPPGNEVAVLLCECPHNDEIGYAVEPDNASDETLDAASAIFAGIVTTYRALGRKIAYVPTNDFLSLETGFLEDHIHPNATGNIQIADAIRSVVEHASEIEEGWTLDHAVIGDFSGTRATPTSIDGSYVLQVTLPGSAYGVVWLNSTGNAVEWQVASGSGSTPFWICWGDGSAGWCGNGDYSAANKPPTVSGQFPTASGITEVVDSISCTNFGTATRFRASRTGNLIRFEALVLDTGWIAVIDDVDISAVFDSTYRSTLKIGHLVADIGAVGLAKIRIGTKV